VVGSVVDSIDTKGVDAKFLKLWNVSVATIFIRNWVGYLGGSAWLVVKSTDVKTVIAAEESYAGY
jgi:hypothetical protein